MDSLEVLHVIYLLCASLVVRGTDAECVVDLDAHAIGVGKKQLEKIFTFLLLDVFLTILHFNLLIGGVLQMNCNLSSAYISDVESVALKLVDVLRLDEVVTTEVKGGLKVPAIIQQKCMFAYFGHYGIGLFVQTIPTYFNRLSNLEEKLDSAKCITWLM